jgi:hypothetical protein
VTAKVVSINPVDEMVRNVPSMLRALADQIESGVLGYVPEQLLLVPVVDYRVQPPLLFGLPARHYEVLGMLADAQRVVIDEDGSE